MGLVRTLGIILILFGGILLAGMFLDYTFMNVSFIPPYSGVIALVIGVILFFMGKPRNPY